MFKKPLYRDPHKGKIAGVCAGLAESLDAETWLIRIIAVTLAITNFGLFAIAYGAAWLFLDKKPPSPQSEQEPISRKEKVWQRGQSAADTLHSIDRRFNDFEQRINNMEKCVTSREFKLRKEFEQL